MVSNTTAVIYLPNVDLLPADCSILLRTDDFVPNNRRRIACGNSRDNTSLHLLLCTLTINNT